MKCIHCGTEFASDDPDEKFCCRGCEFVHHLIHDEGFDQFYDLKGESVNVPVRSRPFEEHDFSWLAPIQETAEAEAREKGTHAHADFSLEGISCVGCVWLIERLFLRFPGAVRAHGHPATGRLRLEWTPGACPLEEALREFAKFGYLAGPPSAGSSDRERSRLTARLGLCGAFALNAMAFSLPGYLGMPRDFAFAEIFRLVTFLSATFAMLAGGGYFIGRAWRALRTRTLHIDLPIALGLLTAYAGSLVGWMLGEEHLIYFDFVAIFVFLMLGGRWLQTAAIERNRRRLIRRQPVPETLDPADGDDPIPLASLKPGTRFRLRHGCAVPATSLLAGEAAEFSLEWINGESDSVRFEPGRRIPAGAILFSRQPATLTADEAWTDSLLARLTRPNSEERRSPVLERVLGAYLVAILLVGLGAWIGWALAGHPLTGLQAMISVFVVSCPCSLGVAVPMADELSATLVQREGVFVRSATLWPRLRRVKKLIFDKTGTLTLERPILENPEELEKLDDQAALALARLTSGSLHPVSRTLLEALGARGQKLLQSARPAPEIKEIPGFGVVFGGEDAPPRWSLGRPGWTGETTPISKKNTNPSPETGHPSPASSTPASSATELRRDGRLVASFHFRESLRPGAAMTLEFLRRRGFSFFILSGDHPKNVARIAAELELDPKNALGGLDPIAKQREVRRIDQHDTLYLGDGANDSLAFDAAYVTGTPVVDRSLLESKADFYTLGSGLAFLSRLLSAADARARGVLRTFAFATLYNLAAVGLCLAGAMHPLLAAILMPVSSVVSILIVASSLTRKSVHLNG